MRRRNDSRSDRLLDQGTHIPALPVAIERRDPADRRGPRARRRLRLLAWILVWSAAAAGIAASVGAHLIWNRTASIPRGLYWVHWGPVRMLRREELVVFPVPLAIRRIVRERGYLPPGAMLLKPVAALPGDSVCTERGPFEINGRVLGWPADRDTMGRSLPRFVVCGRVPVGAVYVAAKHPRSLDSRAFGPIGVETIQGKATPLWTL